MTVHDLPTLNAALNATATFLLVGGYTFIRRGNIRAHKACMITASVVSVLFLASYITYHNMAGFTRYTGEGWIRTLYFAILIPHTVLASVAIPPLVVITLFFALRDRRAKHRRIARWTLPIWLFVSVTGVVIYWMLYQL